MSAVLVVIVGVAATLYLLKPFMAVLIYISMLLTAPYRKRKKSGRERHFVVKLLAAPSLMINKLVPGADRYVLYHISLIPWMTVRKTLYRSLGANLGKNVRIHFKTEIRDLTGLTIEEGAIIGDNALLDARNGLTIGRFVNLSSNVSIYTEQHNYRDKLFRCNQPGKKSIEIGERAWIGCNVIVLPGVTIGEGAVCCAGCVVTKDVEPWSVVAGIPAVEVGKRPTNQEYIFKSHAFALI